MRQDYCPASFPGAGLWSTACESIVGSGLKAALGNADAAGQLAAVERSALSAHLHPALATEHRVPVL